MAHAHKEEESLKRHGDVLETARTETNANAKRDPVPMPENGSHEKSHAAHLGGTVHDHTKRAGDLRKSVDQGELREPPMVVQRVGKEHRKQ